MPSDLPGFYFDPEKNRYFPIKRPGDKALFPDKTQKCVQPETERFRRTTCGTTKLLHTRELSGKALINKRRSTDFRHEYQKLLASQPVVWKYKDVTYNALEKFHALVETPHGRKEACILAVGNINGDISFFGVGVSEWYSDNAVECNSTRISPPANELVAEYGAPPSICGSIAPSVPLLSSTSCIKKMASSHNDSCLSQHLLIATLGSGISGGSLYVLHLMDPVHNYERQRTPLQRRVSEVFSTNHTIWTADVNSSGTKAAIGTNKGAGLVSLETGVLSWVCRSKSDILSQQFDQSGNIIFCGFRNGAIAAIDARYKHTGLSGQSVVLPKQTIPYPSTKANLASIGDSNRFSKKYFQFKGNLNPSGAIFMPSSICSLSLLQSEDHYLLASSMDGSIKLFDCRALQRGAVQSYDGHVNSHSLIQLGVDPTGSILMCGGEDGHVRIWSVKSGELLYDSEISESVVHSVCWSHSIGDMSPWGSHMQDHSWAAWLAPREGLFYVHGS